ncbi:hypothetical protein NDU88_001591 [Pleurodeles waltl]|uniref:Uncharacterized protein n=1 Tax=Pleurodeles waltl TaxID=8319 RepID=A0AAV7SDB6_PLEWA|nr:hypothetical protein NDU88_001591 [Pleurodeles waltl]
MGRETGKGKTEAGIQEPPEADDRREYLVLRNENLPVLQYVAQVIHWARKSTPSGEIDGKEAELETLEAQAEQNQNDGRDPARSWSGVSPVDGGRNLPEGRGACGEHPQRRKSKWR